MSSADRDPDLEVTKRPASRRELLRSGGVAAVAGLLSVFGIASAASAKNGDAIRAGEKTTATKSTSLESKRGPALQVRATGSGDAVGMRGVTSSKSGIAVLGEATSGKGESVGVQGTAASGDGVAGRFIATGGGTAVEARAAQKDGVALRTRGRVVLSERSGINQVSGGMEFVIPVTGGLNDRSLVLATLQDHHPGVHVESASVLDPEEGIIVVRLNQALPEPARVGWLVLD